MSSNSGGQDSVFALKISRMHLMDYQLGLCGSSLKKPRHCSDNPPRDWIAGNTLCVVHHDIYTISRFFTHQYEFDSS